MRHTAVIVLALQLAVAITSLAQQATPSLYPGSVLRITVAAGDRVSGTLFRSDPHGIVLRQDGDTVRIAWKEVDRLEIARATRGSNALKAGAGIGGTIGFLAGVATTVWCANTFDGWPVDASGCAGAIPFGVLAGVALGSAVGGAIQIASSTGGWREVPLGTGHARLEHRRNGFRFGIGARIAF